MPAAPTLRAGEEGFGFDSLAHDFDSRAGLPPGVAERVAAGLADLATPAPGDLILELGAGTGEIGALLGACAGVRYLGVDLSLGMLARFRARSPGAWLARADAGGSWPLAAAPRLVFASRAAHLLGAGHLAAELARRRHPRGTWMALGRVVRQETSVRDELRRHLRGVLAERGLVGRDAAASARELVTQLSDGGGRTRLPWVVASWPVRERPADALAAWARRPGLAGRALSAEVKAVVLARAAEWAAARFGGLTREFAAVERYELSAVELPGEAE